MALRVVPGAGRARSFPFPPRRPPRRCRRCRRSCNQAVDADRAVDEAVAEVGDDDADDLEVLAADGDFYADALEDV